MINYTERIALLMDDIVRRTPRLSFINMKEVLVFGRFGRSDAEGAFATCHCLTLPESEPGYYFWRDRETGQLTRRSEWFVTKSPEVRIGATRITYLISFVLPRFCNQTLERSRKAAFYPGAAPWLAKLDTIVHELYHIDPAAAGIRKLVRADGSDSHRSHVPEFYEEVSEMVKSYLDTGPDPALFDFLAHDFGSLNRTFGGLVGTAFRNYPSFPQRYMEAMQAPPAEPTIRIEPMKPPTQPMLYTEADLQMRHFSDQTARRLTSKGAHRAA